MSKWDKRFLELAYNIANWSKDRSTKVGAIIVRDRIILSTGYNGFPRNINDDIEERHHRPTKYDFSEHAERNAIYNAARIGNILEGSTLYCTFPPCVDCARAIIQSGIKVVITSKTDKTNWKSSQEKAEMLFKETLVKYKQINLCQNQ